MTWVERKAWYVCEKATERSPYCQECAHAVRHQPTVGCHAIAVTCTTRPWVGKVLCREIVRENA